MLIEIIIALLLGCTIGTFTGLIPGIHVNLLTIFLISVSASLLTITSPIILSVFIISMAITHTFIDFIPSIFLGAPDEDSFLSILPGHKLLLKGHAYAAVILTLYGSLTALLIIIIFTPIFINLLPIIYPYLQKIMWMILLPVSLFLIFREKENKILALVIFLLAGFLGIASLNLNIKEPLLPLLTGLFGASSLTVSLKQKTKIPKQKIIPIKKIKLPKKSYFKATLTSVIAAPFTAFLPGLGASQAAVIGNEITLLKQKEFLFLLGAINTIVMGLSFITLYSINKTRTGASVAISNLLPNLTLSNLITIITVITITGIFASIITINLAKIASRNINKIKYPILSIIIITILLIITLLFSDFTLKGKIISLIIFVTSTSLGTFTILSGVRRMHLMGCLLLPTILFYLL